MITNESFESFASFEFFVSFESLEFFVSLEPFESIESFGSFESFESFHGSTQHPTPKSEIEKLKLLDRKVTLLDNSIPKPQFIYP